MTEKQAAIVTGGTSGIGLGLSEALIRAGYAVVVVGRDQERPREAVRTLGSAAQWRRADVGCRADVETAFADFDRMDVLVNAAGFIRPVSLATSLREGGRSVGEGSGKPIPNCALLRRAVIGGICITMAQTIAADCARSAIVWD
ncbi:SDR family NAD(P)-dependent oxidoreductase [Xanthobacter sp. KR7-225]|uniref:SDR family oxidoreductase n=1 Tax=Xanthobacter sp. KR7-225 TaxID=3156613 RepID=UPI0032B33009